MNSTNNGLNNLNDPTSYIPAVSASVSSGALNYSMPASTAGAWGNVGGLIGSVFNSDGNTLITNSSSSSTVNGRITTGGGGVTQGSINLGGLIGLVSVLGSDSTAVSTVATNIKNSVATGAVSGLVSTGADTGNQALTAGGLIGAAYVNNTISSATASISNLEVSLLVIDSTATGNVSTSTDGASVTGSGWSSTGGLFGSAYVSSAYAASDNPASESSYAATLYITNASASGSVSGLYGAAGGLIGGMTSNVSYVASNAGGVAPVITATAMVSNSRATGTVVGSGALGGLVGNNWSASSGADILGLVAMSQVVNSYSTGSVTGLGSAGSWMAIGGLVGQNGRSGSNATAVVSKSYSNGVVSGANEQSTGGLIGMNSGTVENSFWDTSLSGRSSSDGGQGMTTNEMAVPENYTSETLANGMNNPDWDFTNIWIAPDGTNPPTLQVFGLPPV
jgi:hypothetical protein